MINYDSLAECYDEQYKSDMCERENKAVESLLQKYDVANKKTLDIGCGTGFALDMCRIHKYKGIDISKEMVTKARMKYPTKDFTVADIKSAYLGLEMFDCVLCLFSIPYIGEDAAEIIHKNLKRGGICICVYYNKPYLNPKSVYFERKEYYKQEIRPKVKTVMRAFKERFTTLEEYNLISNGTYTVSVFKKGD